MKFCHLKRLAVGPPGSRPEFLKARAHDRRHAALPRVQTGHGRAR